MRVGDEWQIAYRKWVDAYKEWTKVHIRKGTKCIIIRNGAGAKCILGMGRESAYKGWGGG